MLLATQLQKGLYQGKMKFMTNAGKPISMQLRDNGVRCSSDKCYARHVHGGGDYKRLTMHKEVVLPPVPVQEGSKQI
jgi:hypothetical protein